MKILHIIPSLIKGGAERITLDICSQLAQTEEHEVKLIYFRDINDYDSIVSPVVPRLINISFKLSMKGKSKGNIFELQQFIDEFQPDVIHSHLFESEIMLSQVNLHKAKYIVHFHDNMYQFKKWKGKITKSQITNWFERKTVLKSYKNRRVEFIGISKDTMGYINENIPKKFKKHFLLNAINLERFKEPDNNIRDDFKLIMIGSLVNKKNQQLAIQVVNHLNDIGYPFTLDLLGDGPNKESLLALINSLNLEKSVFLRGNVDNPESYLHQSGIYLHTATYEPFGLVLVEAMAAGIPIVCTDGKGNRDLIDNEVNGLIDSTFDVKIIADLILLIHSDNQFKNNLVQSAKTFSKDYDIKRYTEKLIRIYKD